VRISVEVLLGKNGMCLILQEGIV